MEYKIKIKKEGLWYCGYTNEKYMEQSCAITKIGCKHNIKKVLKKTREKLKHIH